MPMSCRTPAKSTAEATFSASNIMLCGSQAMLFETDRMLFEAEKIESVLDNILFEMTGILSGLEKMFSE